MALLPSWKLQRAGQARNSVSPLKVDAREREPDFSWKLRDSRIRHAVEAGMLEIEYL